jgi:hypothetical protein
MAYIPTAGIKTGGNDYAEKVGLMYFWIDVFKERNRTTSKYAAYKTSNKCKMLIKRIYRIMLAEEDLPTSARSTFYKNKTYTDKVYNKAIDDMINDKEYD